MHTPIPLFLSVGVGVQFRICPKHQFWGVLWGLWAVFWLFVGKHMVLHKFGSQSILRLQNRGVGFVVGLGFPVGGFGGVLALSVRLLATAERGYRKSCNNCGGVPHFRLSVRLGSSSVALALAVGSVMLVTVAGFGSVPVAFRLGSVAVRPAVPAWLVALPGLGSSCGAV